RAARRHRNRTAIPSGRGAARDPEFGLRRRCRCSDRFRRPLGPCLRWYRVRMTLRVVGAGVGRTGTMSLKLALERLIGAPCYHMLEVFPRPAHFGLWTAAARGKPVDWNALFAGFAAAVDWPASAFWPELAAAFPDSIILLSTR